MMHLPPTREQLARAKLLENRAWFDRNIEEITAKYRRHFIAVHDCRIVANGPTIEEVMAALHGTIDEEEAFIILVPLEGVHYITYPE